MKKDPVAPSHVIRPTHDQRLPPRTIFRFLWRQACTTAYQDAFIASTEAGACRLEC